MVTPGVSHRNKASISFIVHAQLPNFKASSQLTSFTLFPKLSPELRFKIWALCRLVQRPRLVEIRTLPHDCGEQCIGEKGSHHYCPRYSPSPPPVLWRVSREARMVAREEAFRAGNLCFWQPKGSQRLGVWDGGVPFNHDVDRLYMPLEKRDSLKLDLEWLSALGLQPLNVLEQFAECHHPERVRFLATDLDIHSMMVFGGPRFTDSTDIILQSIPGNTVSTNAYFPQAPTAHGSGPVNQGAAVMPPRSRRIWSRSDSVWTVMQIFPKIEDLVFVLDESGFVYGDFSRKIERITYSLRAEKQRFSHATYMKAVELDWNWPTVRLAIKCEGGGLMDVELNGKGV